MTESESIVFVNIDKWMSILWTTLDFQHAKSDFSAFVQIKLNKWDKLAITNGWPDWMFASL
jgi:hypothetical protein